jgi:hypothetical protein
MFPRFSATTTDECRRPWRRHYGSERDPDAATYQASFHGAFPHVVVGPELARNAAPSETHSPGCGSAGWIFRLPARTRVAPTS